MSDDDALALARRLEEDDERLAATLVEVAELEHGIAALRERARVLAHVIASAPERRAAADGALEEAERELARRREEAAGAAEELAHAERGRDEQRLASARRAVARAQESVSAGERRLERAAAAQAAVERELQEAGIEALALEEQAETASRRLAGVSRISRTGTEPPGSGLGGVDEWASRAAAALFVVRSGLETERERVIREANELASSVLGDPAAGTSVALVRARLERAS